MPAAAIPLENADIKLVFRFLPASDADRLFEQLLERVSWSQPELMLFGKKILSPRLAAWYGDEKAVYCYSGLVNRPRPWIEPLQHIRRRVEYRADADFNSVLLNLYRDGNDAMGWHSDNEHELGANPLIASVSLGATRTLMLRKSSKPHGASQKLVLEHGSLLLMGGQTQHHWQHSISRTRMPVGQRINLTFRYIKA